MRLRMPWSRAALAGVLAAAAVAGGIGLLAARTEAKGDPRVIPLDRAKKRIFGYTPAEWTVQWWQWQISIPVSVNPGFDETGAFVEVGQRGPVWFLVGIFNESGTAARTATIPAGKALLVPLINIVNDNVGVAEPLTVEQLQQGAAEIVGLVDPASLVLEIDGTPVSGLDRGRIATEAFAYARPDNGPGPPRGIYAPAVSDGYWVMVNPLPPGEHTLHFGGTVGPPFNFTLDVTYDLTVVESNRP